MKNLIRFSFLVSVMLIAVTCKKKEVKYPEGTFKGDPSKQPIFQGHLTTYNVAGIDSLILLNKFVNDSSGCEKIQDVYFNVSTIGATPNNDRYTRCFGYFSYTMSNDYKTVSFQYSPDYYGKNLFIQNFASWEILKIEPHDKSDPTVKIRATFNGMLYTIQFN